MSSKLSAFEFAEFIKRLSHVNPDFREFDKPKIDFEVYCTYIHISYYTKSSEYNVYVYIDISNFDTLIEIDDIEVYDNNGNDLGVTDKTELENLFRDTINNFINEFKEIKNANN